MRRLWWGAGVFALVLALTAVTSAQRSQMIQQSEAQAAAAAAREQAQNAQKFELARQIIRAREEAQQRGPFSEAVVG